MFTRGDEEGASEDSGLSRRGFLGVSGAVGAAALTGGRVGALATSLAGDEQTDVVVVGGGLAGLSAARELHAAGTGVLVLEATSSPAVRAAWDKLSGASASESVPDGHEAVLSLARDLGMPTWPAPIAGGHVTTVGGQRFEAGTGELCGDPDVEREVTVALRTLNLMAAEVDPAVPWAASNTSVRDRTSLGAWITENVGSREGRGLFTLLSRSMWAVEPAELSLLQALATIAGSGGIGPLVDASLVPGWPGPRLTPAGEHDDGASCRTCRRGRRPWEGRPPEDAPRGHTVIGGGQGALVDRLARALRTHVRTSTPVRSISQDADQVTVAGDGFNVRARHVVVALPPTALAGVAFDPELPTAPERTWRLGAGDVATVVCRYDSLPNEAPAHAGGTGGVLTVARVQRDRSGATLVAHGCGAAARSWRQRPGDERRRATLGELTDWFGPAAGTPRSYTEHDRSRDAVLGAGWSVVAPPGGVTALRGLREPHGRVHWAGADRAVEWAGRLEGAVRSGQRAAREILEGAAAEPAEVVTR